MRTRSAIGFVSGAAALSLALQACSSGPGGPESASQSGDDLAGGPLDVNDVMSDADLTGAQGVSAGQVQAFLASKGSALAGYADPSTGQTAAEIIVARSQVAHVSPVYMLARIETESSLVTSGSLGYLDSATGCGCPDGSGCDPKKSGFDNQVTCAASLVRSYLDALSAGQPTVSGWKPGLIKETADPCPVLPANDATAALYTYTPWVGQYSTSTCGRAGVGGTSLVGKLFAEYAPAFPGSSTGGGGGGADGGAQCTTTGTGGTAAIAALAYANRGLGACSTNTLGGTAFASSCTGNGGQPEWWCADFARWVWGASGVADVSQLTAAAGSFYVYGQTHGTLTSTPAVGDAVVFDYKGGGVADHVAIVHQVFGDGSIETVSGDWAGTGSGEVQFSSTSHVIVNATYPGVLNTYAGPMGMTISAFVAPAGVAPSGTGGGSCTASQPFAGIAPTPDGMGYWEAKGDGTVVAHGAAASYGSAPSNLAAPVVGIAATPTGKGYWLVAADGGLFSFGDAAFFGSMGGKTLNAPVVGMAATPDGKGYWMVAADGGLFSFGDAAFHGSMGGKALAKPVVGMAATADGEGYWLVAADGGLFSFGDAAFYGSLGGKTLNAPVVGIAATPDGKGYWLVAADGGLFSFGDAAFLGAATSLSHAPIVGMAADKGGYWLLGGDGSVYAFGNAPTPGAGPYVGLARTPDGNGYFMAGADGSVYAFGTAGWYGSMKGQTLAKPVVGIAATPDGKGYWLVAADGGLFSFGDAGFYGSMGGKALNAPVVGMAGTPDGRGYWLVAADGGLFSFGDAGFYGSMGGKALAKPVVGMAATPDGKGYWLVAADGGLFSFGDAGFYGSMGGKTLSAPVVGMSATVDGKGYWMVASDGGLFSFGDAGFSGSGAGVPHAPMAGMAASTSGYWMVASDGAIYAFGGAPYRGGAN